ncbi:MAG: DUF1800 domain-containing protein [Bacteroidota bacterium]|nr:DUF1800 domain-containing protein [Bacteroidota bacterium]
MAKITPQLLNQHLLWRAGFGPMPDNLTWLSQTVPTDLYRKMEKVSQSPGEDFGVTGNLVDGLGKGLGELARWQQLSKDQKIQLRKQSVEALKSLNLAWLDTMVGSDRQLREKVSFFWHGHFACRVINVYFQQQLINTIRRNALGNFGDLLREVSKSPAMLAFLNNQQNKKQHPNENFAREVMELFTMGRGNYTEDDVKESARAFTGWGFNFQGEFVERPFLHDNGTKTFLGKTGNFDGDDILDIILENRQTAYFITAKMVRFFVGDQVGEDRIRALSDRFYQSNYEISPLLADIFMSDWFYEPPHIGTRIKSPIELMVGIRRMIPMQIEAPQVQLLFQRALGQVLFFPPNVAGWPGGRTWIDSSTLLLRMRIPQLLAFSSEFSLQPKEDDDMTMGRPQPQDHRGKRKIRVSIDWQTVVRAFDPVPRDELGSALFGTLFQTQSRIPKEVLDRYVEKDTRGDYIGTSVIGLMSTPEYQLC